MRPRDPVIYRHGNRPADEKLMRQNWTSYRDLNQSRWPLGRELSATQSSRKTMNGAAIQNTPAATGVSILVSFARTATRFPLCSAQLPLREVRLSVTVSPSLSFFFSSHSYSPTRSFEKRTNKFRAAGKSRTPQEQSFHETRVACFVSFCDHV